MNETAYFDVSESAFLKEKNGLTKAFISTKIVVSNEKIMCKTYMKEKF